MFRYIQYPNLKAHLNALVNINFLEDGATTATLDELMSIASVEILKKVAKLFKIDYHKV